jgi:molybdenum cofactor biosynthesis protein B
LVRFIIFKGNGFKLMSQIDTERRFVPVNFAILTVSDTRSINEDRSGNLLAEKIQSVGHFVISRGITTDDVEKIVLHLKKLVEREDVDVILSTGGTGLTGRDVTVEAHKKIYEKEIDAFGTLFTFISFEKIGTSAIQSRATAGVAGGKYLFALPGSPSACEDAWDGIIEKQFDYRHRPCNFVEIMPRLDEHMRRK